MAEQEAEQVEEPVELVARVAGIDVAKDSGMVCTRVPHPSRAGRRVQQVWSVPARFAAVSELADQLVELGVERVVLESTADYWRIWFYLLEAAGLQVWLVNARDVKNVPGRPKTDLLTELPRPFSGRCGRRGAGVATVPARDHRRGFAAGSGRVGGAAVWCGRGDRGPV